ncbi:MAG: hypothetical protein COX57_01310 [Alphaproteobacteria bacterium CG_4_10_14_0_2_um_filter_63_37]|nr:MAG: hypothetical protein AUJ55_01005 [Proteobacteria bacterium CG1_02_64_396]PJA25797.1 MAG: hypothetical protein COX57_01310 [Alphaproteobacteria bacterium CG_4_10_14_0_2_um_filter_63_37]
MIPRSHYLEALRLALARSRIVALIGPRQCGKTTLARTFLPEGAANYFDLEDPVALARLSEPMTALSGLTGLVVIDEVQRRPDLFPVLRVLADRQGYAGRFLLLGSASGALLRQSSESLAGRMETLTLRGFALGEVGGDQADRLWLRGGFPPAFLAPDEQASQVWRKNFIQTLLERDLPQWGVRTPATALWRFWSMLAHYHGQTWNAAEPARSLGVGQTTTRRYLDILSDAFMVRQLQPWHANIGKRQVKAPKIYIRDSGLLHQLLGITLPGDLYNHPKLGASWEGFALEEVLAAEQPDEAYFWATHQGAEIDLVLRKGGRLLGVEFKRSDAPRLTPSMHHALADVQLEHIAVVYPGAVRYPLSPQVEVVPLNQVGQGRLF